MSLPSNKVYSSFQKIIILFLQENGEFNGRPIDFSEQASEFYESSNIPLDLDCNLKTNFHYNIGKLESLGFVTVTQSGRGMYHISLTDAGTKWVLEPSPQSKVSQKRVVPDTFDRLMKNFSIPGMTMADAELIKKVFNSIKPYVTELEDTVASKDEELALVYEDNSRLEEDVNKFHEKLSKAEAALNEAHCHNCEEFRRTTTEEADRIKREADQRVREAADRYRIHIQNSKNKVLTGETSVHSTSRN